MLQDGGRIGFFTAGLARGDEISPGTASKQEGNGPTRRDQDLRDLATKQAEDKKEELVEKFRNKQMQDSNLPGLLGMATKFLKKPLQAGMTGTRNFVLNKVIDAKRGMFKDIDFYSLTPKEQENLMDEYMSARMDNTIDAYGNPIGGGGRDDNEIFIPQGIMTAQASGSMDQETDTDTETEDQDERFLAFRADGGRIGFFKGAVAGGGNISPGTDVKGNVRDDNPFTGGRPDDSGPSAPPPSVINPPPKEPFLKTRNVLEGYKQHNINNQKLKNAVTLGLISNDEYNILGGYDVNQTMGLNPFMTGVTSGLYNVYQTLKGDQPVSEIYGDVKRNVEGSFGLQENLQTKYDDIMSMSTEEMIDQLSDQKLAQMADGGRIGFRIGSDSGKDVSGREYGAQSVSTSPSGDNGSSGGDNLTDTTTKQVLENAGKTAVKNVATNKAIEKLGLGGIFGMAPQVAALLGIINSVRNSQTNEENMFADGGRIGFFMGSKLPKGLATLREMLNFMGKQSDQVINPSDVLKMINRISLNVSLEDPRLQ